MKKSLIVGFAAATAALVACGDASPWVYLPSESESVISNNNDVGVSTGYVLNVNVLDADSHTLSVGNGTIGSAYRQYGGETLDLSERIEDADGTQWTIEELSKDCLYIEWAAVWLRAPDGYASFPQCQEGRIS